MYDDYRFEIDDTEYADELAPSRWDPSHPLFEDARAIAERLRNVHAQHASHAVIIDDVSPNAGLTQADWDDILDERHRY